MARRESACPACGGTVEFRSTLSLVTVCPYCHSVVARQDRRLEDHGKVAEIAESQSPLQLGLRGKWRGKAFHLIGRVQYRHSAGGLWDEWYVEFPNGKWGWLSEAQGRFGILQSRTVKDPKQLPAYDALHAGEKFPIGDAGELTVTEVGRAVVAGAEGELPFSPVVQSEHRFIDLEGRDKILGTLEYGPEGTQLFLGEAATLFDLDLMDAALKEESVQKVGAAQLNCPQCAGPLELMQPDAAQRVTCPNCRALLSVEPGQKLEYLETLKAPKPPLKITLGSKGTLRGVEYRVLGYLRRSVTYDKNYYWQEYLLYSPRHGYAWLMESDDHWSLGRPVPVGSVEKSFPTATFEGRTFKVFQKAEATVRQVWGEFYWKVAVGDSTQMIDYVAPPQSLTLETASEGTASEVNATVSDYLPHAEVEQAFGLQPLPRGWGVAPNQPNPITSAVYLQWAAFLLGVGLIHVAMPVLTGHPVDLALSLWAAGLVSTIPASSLMYAHSFERRRWQDSEYNPYATEGDDDE